MVDIMSNALAGKRNPARVEIVIDATERRLRMQTAREVAARVWCDNELARTAMDCRACEAIAQIVYMVLREQARTPPK